MSAEGVWTVSYEQLNSEGFVRRRRFSKIIVSRELKPWRLVEG